MKNFVKKTMNWSACCLLLLLAACEATEPTPEELITTVRLTFQQTGGESKTFTWKDADGDGTLDSVDEIKLAPMSSYNLSVELLNETVSPAEDITAEVMAESTAHLFVYEVTGAEMTFSAPSVDTNGQVFGLENVVETAAASAGTLKVVLKHEPDKSAANPAATGETDVEVTFPVRIE